MAEYGELVRDPRYSRSLIAAEHKTVTVERVYDNGTAYVGVLRGDDGKSYLHEVPKGSDAEKAKCEAFGVANLRNMTGKTLDVYVDGKDIVAAQLHEKGQSLSYNGVF